MKVSRVVVCGLVAMVALSARAAAQQPTDAATLYGRQCASCHGAAGTPNPAMARSLGAMPDFADARGVAAQPDSVLLAAITAGKGRGMPAYRSRLSAVQIRALVTYVKSLSKRPAH
jgi:mono/diheme cytochrome c family protein